jgi:hypothetical protein
MMEGMLEVRAKLHPETIAAIERIVEGQPTLEEVTRWALAQKPPRIFARCRATFEPTTGQVDDERAAPGFDLVVQDEFTHDVVVPWDAAHTIFLVYDTT